MDTSTVPTDGTTKITLTETEKKLAKELGKRRYEECRKGGVKDNLQDKNLNPAENDILAAGAELAVARALNCYPDLSLDLRSGGHDLIWKGFTVDIKRATKPDGGLNLTRAAASKQIAQIFVLATGGLDEYAVVGWLWGKFVAREEHLTDVGNGPFYSVPQSGLMSLKTAISESWWKMRKDSGE